MFLDTYSKVHSYPQTNGLNVEKSFCHKSQFSFLYIGNNSIDELNFSSGFKSGHCCDDMFSAKSFLNTEIKKNELLPDVVIFDLVLDKSEYLGFIKYMEFQKIDRLFSVIYNESKLNSSEIEFLKKYQLVDDVFCIENRNVNFEKKISFIKKVKNHNNRLQVSSSVKKDAIRANYPKQTLFCKRIIDIVFSSILLIIALPLFIIIAVCIKLESRGPVFYISHRAGKGFKIFNFYKFRTMEVDADKKVPFLRHLNKYSEDEKGVKFLKINNDPRVTRFGKFLRRTSLDEMPQMFNVLIGDMSLVGNRPLPLYEASTLTTNEFVERFMAPAGITGLWQIKKKGKPNMTAEERINLDISYARQFNLLNDFRIIAKTPWALFQKCNS